MPESIVLNGYEIFPFKDNNHFLNFLDDGHWNNILVALNAEKLMKIDAELKDLVNNHIGYPDGIGAVLALKRKGISSGRIPGAEFWLDIIDRHYKDKTFYLVGGKKEVIDMTVAKLKKNYPGINIVNYRDGYMDEAEYNELLEDIVIKKPDIVFVAMGSPRQEYIMEEMYSKHEALYMGLGGSFDIYCDLKERAPDFFRKNGLEWLYRLFKEPSRLSRQIVYVPFLYKVLRNKL
jgi:UDP-N-acetyl-D-mannosaminouronate:lipid I N-acetyl-D-mannosaminouronosyltransferase